MTSEMTESDIDIMYRQVANAGDTEVRIRVFERYGYDLPPIDNYECTPGSDPTFEAGWHRWYYLYQLTKGVERAAVLNIAFELHRSSPNLHFQGTGFFSHGFSDATRKFYLAKAMCIMYMGIVEDRDCEVREGT